MAVLLGRKLISSLLNKIWKSCRRRTKKTMHSNIAPKGSFFVYVGEEHKRYVVPISLSSSLSFKGLLEEYEEEMQASTGPLTLPSCSTSEFEAILRSSNCVKADDQKDGVRGEIEKMGLLIYFSNYQDYY